MFREGIARMLEKEPDFTIAGQASSSAAALEQIAVTVPNLVLLDVDLGAERAIDFVSRSRRVGYQGRTLIVTAGLSEAEAVQLVQSGVSGIVHKHRTSEELKSIIRQVAGGEVWIEKNYLGSLFRRVDRSHQYRHPPLTERDKTVLRLLLQGSTNREMAAHIGISEGAVKASLRYVCEKLRVRNRAQLVKVALEQLKDQLQS